MQHTITEIFWRANAGIKVNDPGCTGWYTRDKYRNSIYNVIAQGISDCVTRRAEFAKCNPKDVIEFDAKPYKQKFSAENWNAVILWNFLARTVSIGEYNGLISSYKTVEEVGREVNGKYASNVPDIEKYVNAAVSDIKEYAKGLNLYEFIEHWNAAGWENMVRKAEVEGNNNIDTAHTKEIRKKINDHIGSLLTSKYDNRQDPSYFDEIKQRLQRKYECERLLDEYGNAIAVSSGHCRNYRIDCAFRKNDRTTVNNGVAIRVINKKVDINYFYYNDCMFLMPGQKYAVPHQQLVHLIGDLIANTGGKLKNEVKEYMKIAEQFNLIDDETEYRLVKGAVKRMALPIIKGRFYNKNYYEMQAKKMVLSLTSYLDIGFNRTAIRNKDEECKKWINMQKKIQVWESEW